MVGTPAFVYDFLRGCHDKPAPDTATRASAVRTIVSVLGGASPSPPPPSAGSPSSAGGVVGAAPGTYWQCDEAAPASPGLAADPGIPSRSPVHTISNGPPARPPGTDPPPGASDAAGTAGALSADPPPEPPTTDDAASGLEPVYETVFLCVASTPTVGVFE